MRSKHPVAEKTQRGRGRPKLYADRIALRLRPGQVSAIGELLEPDEAREEFIRGAIEREIKRRAKSRR